MTTRKTNNNDDTEVVPLHQQLETRTTKTTIQLERPPLRESSSVCNWQYNAETCHE